MSRGETCTSDEKRLRRLATFNRIEVVLENNCRRCEKNNVDSTNCGGCPILSELQKLGLSLGAGEVKERVSLNLSEAQRRTAEANGLHHSTIAFRMKKGMTKDQAVSMPIQKDFWSKEDDLKIKNMRDAGMTMPAIAKALNRTAEGVRSRWYRINKLKKKGEQDDSASIDGL